MNPQSKPKMKTNAYDEMVEASSKYDANFLNKFGLKDVKTEKKTTYYEYKGKDEPQQLPKKKKNISGSKSDKNESILRKVNEIIKVHSQAFRVNFSFVCLDFSYEIIF